MYYIEFCWFFYAWASGQSFHIFLFQYHQPFSPYTFEEQNLSVVFWLFLLLCILPASAFKRLLPKNPFPISLLGPLQSSFFKLFDEFFFFPYEIEAHSSQLKKFLKHIPPACILLSFSSSPHFTVLWHIFSWAIFIPL